MVSANNDAICDRLPHLEAVLLLTHSGYALDHTVLGYDIASLRDAKFYYQHRAWQPLQDHPKVSAYQMVKEGLNGPPPYENMQNIIYTHWKVLIVDDEYAIIGSAGVEQSGMTNDLDMSVGIYDPAAVKQIRKHLWSEHLNLDPDNVNDPLHAIRNLWPKAAEQLGRVRRFGPKPHNFGRTICIYLRFSNLAVSSIKANVKKLVVMKSAGCCGRQDREGGHDP